MIKAQFLIGVPVDFKKICRIYPPTVRDVIANQDYSLFLKLLTFSQEEIEDEFNEHGYDLSNLLTPFEYIFNNAYHNQQFKQLLLDAFMFFTHETVYLYFEQKQIIMGDLTGVKSVDELRVLKEEDFFEFQNLIRMSVGSPAIEPPHPNEDPRVKAIKAKARYRDKIKAKQGKNLTLDTILASICCMDLGLNPLNIGELSYAAIPALMARYQEKEKYGLDIDSLLAGADSKKVKPKYWIRNLED